MDKNPSSNIRVYAIWFSTLAGAARDKWDSELLTDPRVVQYWDEGKVSGRFFADQEGFVIGPIAYDVYYLYGPDSAWEIKPAPLISSGYTLIGNADSLRSDLLDSLMNPISE